MRREGACRRIVVLGEPGIGKSRIAAELVSMLGEEARVLTGRCVAYGEGATYLPLVDVLNEAAPGAGDLRTRISTVLVGNAGAENVADRLAGTAGAATAGGTSEVSWAARRLLETLSKERPLVVLFEDVHWAEPTFLDLVEYLAGWTQASVLLLCLARMELLDVRPQWGDAALVLGPLDEGDARSLVDALPGREALGEDDLPALLETAGGFPLFLEQLTASAAETPLEAGRVPATVEALIASRLDRLDAWERGVLDRAAVAGREFWRGGVDELSPENERGAVGQRLLSLARRRLVRPDRSTLPGEDGFRFHHALIRDVAYSAIPKAERARLHERLARWLDARAEKLDELVGYHLEQSAQLQEELGHADAALALEAGERLGDAGMSAFKRLDAHAVINLLRRAVTLLPENHSQRLQLECALGTAIKFSGDAAKAESTLHSVAKRARASGDRRVELWACIEQAAPRLSRGATTPDEVLALVDQALPALEAAHDNLPLGRTWHLAAVAASLQLRHTEAEQAASRASEYYALSDVSSESGATLLAEAIADGPTPIPVAIARIGRLLEETPTPAGRSFVLPILARLEAMTGNVAAARAHLSEAREGRREFIDPATIATSWARLAAEVELLAGHPEAAEEILVPACEALRGSSDFAWFATNLAWLAEAQYQQRRLEEASTVAEEALHVAPPSDLYAQNKARRALAKARARLGRFEEAERLARRALELFASTDDLGERGRTLADLAEVLCIGGDERAATLALDEALSLLEAQGDRLSAERARSTLLAEAR